MTRRFGPPGNYYVTERSPDIWEDDALAPWRDEFLEVAILELPDVIPSYRQEVAPPLHRLLEALPDGQKGWLGVNNILEYLDCEERGQSHRLEQLPVDAVTAARVLREARSSWEDRWHLRENPWFEERLRFRGIDAWQVRHGRDHPGSKPDPEGAERTWTATWLRSTPGRGNPLEVPPLTLPGWDPERMTWGDYRRWIEREVLPSALEEQKAAVEARASAGELARVPVPQFAEYHLRWLARWQLMGESYDAISEIHREDPATVGKACRRVRERVGLTPREDDT